jgi:hypothetical protein
MAMAVVFHVDCRRGIMQSCWIHDVMAAGV